jgi:WD40 repeat protein
VLVAACSHDGALVATGSADGVIMVWHADHSKELAPMRLKARRVDRCSCHAHLPHILFLIPPFNSPCSLIGHYAPITALAISTIWDVVVSSSSNGSVIVWDVNSVSPINVINTLSVAASSISIGDW